jgi:hypothetical protein
LPACFALVGVLLYVALIPGHVVSQAMSGSLASMQGVQAGPQLETDWTFTFGWQKTLGDC